jgi:hypothetical protein
MLAHPNFMGRVRPTPKKEQERLQWAKIGPSFFWAELGPAHVYLLYIFIYNNIKKKRKISKII